MTGLVADPYMSLRTILLIRNTSNPKNKPAIENQTQAPSREDVKFNDNNIIEIKQTPRHMDNSPQLFTFLFLKRKSKSPIINPTATVYRSNFKYALRLCAKFIPFVNVFNNKAIRMVNALKTIVAITELVIGL